MGAINSKALPRCFKYALSILYKNRINLKEMVSHIYLKIWRWWILIFNVVDHKLSKEIRAEYFRCRVPLTADAIQRRKIQQYKRDRWLNCLLCEASILCDYIVQRVAQWRRSIGTLLISIATQFSDEIAI